MTNLNPKNKQLSVFDTFSANSLKLLEKDVEEFKLKYIENLYFAPDNKKAKAGQNLHNFLCFYLKNFDTSKIETSLAQKDREFIEKIKEFDEIQSLKQADKKYIEQPFLIKCTTDIMPVFYLTGRFDAVLIKEDKVQIYDWKTLNLPKNPENDIQTIVYLYCASKLYKSYETQNISITYISLTKNESIEIKYNNTYGYFEKITSLVSKIL